MNGLLLRELQLSSLDTLKLGVSFPLHTAGYLQQLLPSEPGCNLLFFATFDGTQLYYQSFLKHSVPSIQQK